VAQAFLENARHTILVADRMKFERSAPVRVGHLSQLGSLVSYQMPPEPPVKICLESAVRIEIADPLLMFRL